MSQATTFWRLAGMNYLQYVNVASTSLRACVRTPLVKKALDREYVGYYRVPFVGGKESTKIVIGKPLK